jgi:membrane complex biogenesis BtpA family protein
MHRFGDIFGASKPLIGVLHLAPLPGSPDYSGDFSEIKTRAVREAAALAEAGYRGLIVENYGDLPFFKGHVGAGSVAAMALVVDAVKNAVTMPVGVNVLRNDHIAALGIAAACGCEFIRLNILVGTFVTPEGMIEGRPGEVLRTRRAVAPEVMILADIGVKHAHAVAGGSIDEEAMDAAERGKADGVIITGPRTGAPASIEAVKAVKTRLARADIRVPVIVGSGVDDTNAAKVFEVCDGVIVGSYIRKHGMAGGPIEPARARKLAEIWRNLEG